MIQIRDIDPDDRTEYLTMVHDFFHSSAVCHPVPDHHFVRTFEEALKGNPFLRILVFEENSVLAGFSHLSFTWSCEAGGLVVLVDDLYLKPAFRNRGLGSAFFEQLFRDYDAKACRYRLEVSSSNGRAKALYQRLGFEPLDYRQMIRETPQT